jgi:hypothetical protein
VLFLIVLLVYVRYEYFTHQSAEAILDLLKGPRAIVAGVVYLQDEKYTFQVHEGGKEWSVYGSPVCHSFISFQVPSWISRTLN